MADRSGYIQLRRGLFEHVRDGRITFFESSLYIAILVDANPANGIAYGCAGLYAAIFGLVPRTVREALEKLEKKGYLKRFAVAGKHGSYPILINRFLCSDGAMKGKYINAYKTTDYRQPQFESCEEDGEGSGEVNGEVTAASRRLETRDKRIKKSTLPQAKKPAVKKPPDPRHQEFRQDFEKYFEHQQGVPAPWDAKEATNLSRFLKANPMIMREQWRTILNHRAKSPVNNAQPLSMWVGRALTWINGPAHDNGQQIDAGRNGNGKQHHQATAAERAIAATLDGVQRNLQRIRNDRGEDTAGGPALVGSVANGNHRGSAAGLDAEPVAVLDSGTGKGI